MYCSWLYHSILQQMSALILSYKYMYPIWANKSITHAGNSQNRNKWAVHWSLASEHFQFQDRSSAATLDEFATYCAFIKRGPAWLKILSISVNPHCVYQGDLIRVRCPERVWFIWYFSKTCECLRLTKTKDPCRESIRGKTPQKNSDVKPRISHCDSQNLQYKTHPEFWPSDRRIFKTSLYYKTSLILETRRYYFVLEYVSPHKVPLSNIQSGKIMRENYLKSEILENGDNYNLCWIASWFQLFRQAK